MEQCQVGCPIRRSLDQSLFPAPQSLSQGITSFIASCCQGIHQTPFSRLIRSRKGQGSTSVRFVEERGPFAKPLRLATTRPHGSRFWSEVIHSSRPTPGKAWGHLVSVLDLEQNRLGTSQPLSGPAPQSRPHSGEPAVLMFLFLHNVNAYVQLDGTTPHGTERSSRKNLVEPVGIEPTTPCLQSRCSPS